MDDFTLDPATAELDTVNAAVATALAEGKVALPVFNRVALELQQALQDDDTSIDQIEALILEDQTLAGQILRLSNTALYKGLSEITTIRRAVVRLGAQQVANIAMAVAQKNSYRGRDGGLQPLLTELWENAMVSAVGCRWLAQHAGHYGQVEVAFLAGLLHDIGKLVIVAALDQLGLYRRLSAAEVDALLAGPLHADCGYRLLRQWNLPDVYCRACRDHHGPAQDDLLLGIVRLADRAQQKFGVGKPGPTDLNAAGADLALADSAEAKLLGLQEQHTPTLEAQLNEGLQVARSLN